MADRTIRMTPAMADVLGGPARAQDLLERKVKNGRIGKANTVQGVRKVVKAHHHKNIPKKKGVNNFLLFRSKFNSSQPRDVRFAHTS